MKDNGEEECFEQSTFNGWFGEGGKCDSNGNCYCLECKQLHRLPMEMKGKVEECTGCLRPSSLCVCPSWLEISYTKTNGNGCV